MAGDLLKDKKMPMGVLLKRTFPYLKTEMKSFIFAFALILINVVIGILTPRIAGYYTDYLSGDNPALKIIVIIAISMFVIALLNQALFFIESMVLTKAGQRIVYKLRMQVFAHIESMSQNQFNDMAVGSLVTRVCSYTSQLSEFFTNTLVRLAKNILTVLTVYIWMIVMSWKLGMLLLAVIALIFIISFVFWKKVHKIFSTERHQLSDMNTYLNESLSGMKIDGPLIGR